MLSALGSTKKSTGRDWEYAGWNHFIIPVIWKSILVRKCDFNLFDGAALLSEPYPTKGIKRVRTQVFTIGPIVIIDPPMRLIASTAAQMPLPSGFESFLAECQEMVITPPLE